jgi:hypothetical protein
VTSATDMNGNLNKNVELQCGSSLRNEREMGITGCQSDVHAKNILEHREGARVAR